MAFIKGISYYLPDAVLSNDDLAKTSAGWQAGKMTDKVGISSRHIAGDSETAGDMAEKAARNLLREYGILPSEIDFLLLCTQSPDYFLPSTSCILQDRLGIPTSAGALDFNLGCSGAVYGLSLAKGLLSGGIAKNVLLLTAETYSKYITPEDIGNRSIFGDGAAACLVSDDGFAEIGEFSLGTDGSRYQDLIVSSGAARNRFFTGKESVDEDGHIRRDDFLYMNGSAIFNFTLDTVPEMMAKVIEKNCFSREDVDYYVFHQANKFILNTLRITCGIPKDRFYVNLTDKGNTVSSTVLIALKECMANGLVNPGMNVMLAGFGVGLSWGGTILKFK